MEGYYLLGNDTEPVLFAFAAQTLVNLDLTQNRKAHDSTLQPRETLAINIVDLQKGIQAMVLYFSKPTRPSVAEHELFTIPVKPVFEQIVALHIFREHLLAFFFSIIKGEAHKATCKASLRPTSMEVFFTSINNVVVYDKDVQDRCVSEWINITTTSSGVTKVRMRSSVANVSNTSSTTIWTSHPTSTSRNFSFPASKRSISFESLVLNAILSFRAT